MQAIFLNKETEEFSLHCFAFWINKRTRYMPLDIGIQSPEGFCFK